MTATTQTRSSELKLAELAEQTGVPARTIRLYIAQGVLPGPLRAGRDAAYGKMHVERLREIRQLQAEGLTLAEIRGKVNPAPASAPLAAAERWLRIPVGEDVQLLLREDISPRRFEKAIAVIRELMSDTERVKGGTGR